MASITLALVTVSLPSSAAAGGDLERLSGTDRFETALAVSQKQFADQSATIAVIYNGYSPVDALAGVSLLSAANGLISGPMLPIRTKNAIDSDILAELQRVVQPGSRVYVLGGNDVMDKNVNLSLVDLGYNSIWIGGNDRFETAGIIAREVIALRQGSGNTSPVNFFFANGYAIADALAVAPLAASQNGVVLLTYQDAVPVATKQAVDHSPGGLLYMVGGTGVISKIVAEEISYRHYSVNNAYARFDGKNRYDTSHLIAQGAFNQGEIGLVNGISMVDAFPGAALAAAEAMPILLTSGENLNCFTAAHIEENELTISSGFVFGGTTVVTQTAEEQAEALMNGLTTAANIGC